MSGPAYVGTAKRTFKQAIGHLLQSEYAILGSDQIVQLLASDIEQLAEQFYPKTEHLSSGWTVFTGTKACGGKAYPGQQLHDHQLVTMAWPLHCPKMFKLWQAISQRTAKRLVTICANGSCVWSNTVQAHQSGPVLLTLADLSTLLGLNTVEVSKLLAEAREQSGKPLPTMGYYFDQGMRPTHKGNLSHSMSKGWTKLRSLLGRTCAKQRWPLHP